MGPESSCIAGDINRIAPGLARERALWTKVWSKTIASKKGNPLNFSAALRRGSDRPAPIGYCAWTNKVLAHQYLAVQVLGGLRQQRVRSAGMMDG
jgi:hypothetical protein